MAFNKLDKSTLNAVTSLSDRPNKQDNLDAKALKQKFTDNAETIADFINNLIDLLAGANATTEYGSGAKNIGVTNRSEFSTYTNVEDVLVYFRELIRSAVAGELGDNDVTTNLLNHTYGSEAVDSGAIRTGAVTNDKITSVSIQKVTGDIPTNRLSGQITNNQLAGNITYDKLLGAIRATQLYGEIPFTKLASDILIPLYNGGTGARTPSAARTNLEVTEQGKIKIDNTEYTLRIGTEGAEGYITFVL